VICPHCHRSIREEKVYLMSQRTPKDEELTGHMRAIAYAGGMVLVFLITLGALIALHTSL